MHKLILLRGNSGSGKTTVAKQLQEKFGPNTMLISHDMVRKQILWCTFICYFVVQRVSWLGNWYCLNETNAL